MSTTVVEFENQDVIVVEMSGRGPIGPRGRQGEPGPAGPSEWGVIQGNISDQTDLQNALDAKADVGASYTKSEEDALLAQKADADSVYTKTETDSLLADKADTDDVYSKTDVNTLLNGKADADTVYTKTETDALLDAKADVGDSYTKAEEDALLAVKANSADVYTKTETDTLLADKADADDVYTKDDVDDALADKADSADVYTKTETDTLLLGKAPVILSNASGSIASFTDGSPAPVTALSVSIDPVQDLHGYDNPWPAGGGKNKWDTSRKVSGKFILSNATIGNTVNYNNSSASDVYEKVAYLTAGTTYTISYTKNTPSSNNTRAGVICDDNGIVLENSLYSWENANSVTITPTVSGWLYATVDNASTNFQIEQGSSATSFAPYENICPISGHTSATVTRTGVNLCNVDDENVTSAYVDGRGRILSNSSWTTSVLIPVESGKPYCLSGLESHPNTNTDNYRLYDKNKSYLSYIQKNIVNNPYPIIFADGVAFVQFCWKNTDKSTVMFEQSSAPSSYEPYQGQTVTIDLDGTRYGGTLNLLTGELTVTKVMETYDGTNKVANSVAQSSLSGNWYAILQDLEYATSNTTGSNLGHVITNYLVEGETPTAIGKFSITVTKRVISVIPDQTIQTKSAYDAYLAEHPLQVCYPLATPLTVQLTPEQLSTLLGTNNIWADTGDVSVTYRADTKRYIDGKFSQLQALILEN